MTRFRSTAISLCLILSLIYTLLAQPVCVVDGQERKNRFRLYAAAAFGPIGQVESFGVTVINGRPVQGKEVLGGGELIEARGGTSARVMLDAIGQVVILGRASARLATALTKPDDHTQHRTLIASIVSGEIVVKLQPNAGAYIEVDGAPFAASNGSSFRIGIRAGQSVVEVASGEVRAEAPIRQPEQIEIELSRARPTGRYPASENNRFKKNEKVNLIAALKRERKKSSSIRKVSFIPAANLIEGYEPQDKEPVPNTRVRFELIPPGLGTITPSQALTDKNGEVELSFTAGPSRGKGKLRVIVEETEQFKDFGISIETVFVPGLGRIHPALQIAIVAAAGVTVGVIATRSEKKPLKLEPPPIIIP